MRRFLLIVFTACVAWAAPPPETSIKVWISLRDKGPAAAALARGSRAFEDAPVHAPYLAALRARGFRPAATLKWQNLVSGYVSPGDAARIAALPFVARVSGFPRKARPSPLPFKPWNFSLPKRAEGGIDYGANAALAESLRVDRVHAWMAERGMVPGKGIKVAVIDADFHLGSRIFDSLRIQGRLLDQWDFVDGDSQSVDTLLEESHGASCMSLIGGNLPGTLVGMAPAASFLLYRAEDDFQERYIEEDFVAAAIERAVDSGAQVLSISLGYRNDYTDGSPDLPLSEFDGKHRPSSIAAAKAAGRGAIVAVAMGNEGRTIAGPSLGAPADADSILAAGIVDETRHHCAYSSTGYSADGRVKPDVVTMAAAGDCFVHVAAPEVEHGVRSMQGTSFAAPAVAAAAALVRQAHPEMSAMEARAALMTTADHHDSPDSLVGYGLIDVAAALGLAPSPPDVLSMEPRVAGLYHQGGLAPFILPWDERLEVAGLTVVDLHGRNIPVTLRSAGKLLLLDPDRDLRTGVYWVRARVRAALTGAGVVRRTPGP